MTHLDAPIALASSLSTAYTLDKEPTMFCQLIGLIIYIDVPRNNAGGPGMRSYIVVPRK
jgi:hypothetical protein